MREQGMYGGKGRDQGEWQYGEDAGGTMDSSTKASSNIDMNTYVHVVMPHMHEQCVTLSMQHNEYWHAHACAVCC
jgi:hypothetical protein